MTQGPKHYRHGAKRVSLKTDPPTRARCSHFGAKICEGPCPRHRSSIYARRYSKHRGWLGKPGAHVEPGAQVDRSSRALCPGTGHRWAPHPCPVHRPDEYARHFAKHVGNPEPLIQNGYSRT